MVGPWLFLECGVEGRRPCQDFWGHYPSDYKFRFAFPKISSSRWNNSLPNFRNRGRPREVPQIVRNISSGISIPFDLSSWNFRQNGSLFDFRKRFLRAQYDQIISSCLLEILLRKHRVRLLIFCVGGRIVLLNKRTV